MDYKEKLELTRDWYNDQSTTKKEKVLLENLFPELIESKDERMMNQLHSWMMEFGGAEEYTEKVYNWLQGLIEKQGEQKPTKDQVWDYCSKISHEWWQITMDKWETLTDEEKAKYNQFIGFNDFSDVLMNITAGALFQLRDTGKLEYEEGSLLLKKPDDTPKPLEVINENQCEQKPAQEIESFEAEHGKYYYCIKDYFCGGRKQASKGDVVQALRGLPIMSLKDASEYFIPVNSIKCKSTWSEEDKKILNSIIEEIRPVGECPDYPTDEEREYFYESNRKVNWLKSIKPQQHNIMSEDEFAHIVGYIVQDIVANERMSEGEKQPTKVFVEKYYNKLKPQSHWKPTQEQMNLLSEVQQALLGKDCHNRFVNFMYDLKKL